MLFASGQLARLPTQNYAFLLELVKFLRRVHERQVRFAPFLLPNLRDRCSCWQRTPFSALARAFAPAVIRSPAGATAAEPGAAHTFGELLLQAAWDPSLPPLAPSPDQGPTPVEQRAPAPTDVVPMEESIDGGVQGGDTVGGWNLSVSGPARRRVDADTDDDASRMTAPDSTAVNLLRRLSHSSIRLATLTMVAASAVAAANATTTRAAARAPRPRARRGARKWTRRT